MTEGSRAASKRTRRGLRALLVVALLSPGCQWMCGKKKPPEARVDAADDTPVGVEVLSPGREPRAKLEVARWSGLSYELETQIDGSFGLLGLPAAKSPTSILATHAEVLRGTADPVTQEVDGKKLELVEERAHLDRIEIQSSTLPPDMVKQLNAAFALLKGMTTRSLTAPNGELVVLETETVGGVVPPPEVKKVLDEILDAQRHFPFRLPPVPVGLGARWRFSSPLDIRGVKALQVADMTLVELGPKLVRVGIRVRHQAPRQAVAHPMDPNVTARLDALRGDADGEIQIESTHRLHALGAADHDELLDARLDRRRWPRADGHLHASQRAAHARPSRAVRGRRRGCGRPRWGCTRRGRGERAPDPRHRGRRRRMSPARRRGIRAKVGACSS